MKKIVPVILAGGIGERFWPLSRSSHPKQLLPLISSRTMIEETFSRTGAIQSDGVVPLVITGGRIASRMKALLSSRWHYDLIVEPVGKNTAPAIALAAAWIQARYGESIMVILPADHLIRPQRAFATAVRRACTLAGKDNRLVVFGVPPSRPEIGYGYLLLGPCQGSVSGVQWHNVSRFIEKPDAETARRYCKKSSYRWNSGMFVWKTSVLLEEAGRYMPQLLAQVLEAEKAGFSKKAISRFYAAAEKQSIDYGIMERSSRVSAVVGGFEWDDIGSWEALPRIYGIDRSGSTVSGDRIFHQACSNSILVNRSQHAVCAIGCSDIAVIATGDAVLVAHRSQLPDLKKYLVEMKRSGHFSSRLF